MSFYCYKNAKGERIEKEFPMGKAPRSMGLGKRGVFVRDFAREMLSQSARVKGEGGSYYKSSKVKSIAMGVHPSQIPEAMAEANRRKVKVEYDNRGVAMFDSRKQKKEYAEAFGCYDLDGGYGDAQKSSKHLNYIER